MNCEPITHLVILLAVKIIQFTLKKKMITTWLKSQQI